MNLERRAARASQVVRSDVCRLTGRTPLGWFWAVWTMSLWWLVLSAGSATAFAQQPAAAAGFRRVFVPERDLPALGLRDFAPIDLQQLGFLLQGESTSDPPGAVPWEPRLVEAVYVCRYEDRTLVSDASM